jgi:hypothetical protein
MFKIKTVEYPRSQICIQVTMSALFWAGDVEMGHVKIKVMCEDNVELVVQKGVKL